MFGLGLPELLILLLIVLMLFGVGRLPEIGVAIGKAIRGFKKGMSEPDAIDVTPPQNEDKKDE
jgi:sec-independent protein translocase protein TatA